MAGYMVGSAVHQFLRLLFFYNIQQNFYYIIDAPITNRSVRKEVINDQLIFYTLLTNILLDKISTFVK